MSAAAKRGAKDPKGAPVRKPDIKMRPIEQADDATLPPGCCRVEYSYGAHGLDLKGDLVVATLVGSQSETKKVQAGWRVLMVDGQEMLDENEVRGMMHKKSELVYFVFGIR